MSLIIVLVSFAHASGPDHEAFRFIVEITSDRIGNFRFQFVKRIRLREYVMSDSARLEAAFRRFLIEKNNFGIQ